MTFELALSAVGLAAWLYLVAARGGFWRADVRDEADWAPDPAAWPSVAAVVPARNEADVIGASIASLLTQDYPEPLTVILTDDQSDDGTAEAARAAARVAGAADRLTVLPGKPLPPGWTGKLWAQKQGVEQAKLAGRRVTCFLPTPTSPTSTAWSAASSRVPRRGGWC